MILEQVIAHYGSAMELAKFLQIERTNVSRWRRTGHVPYKQAFIIERDSGGLFKATDIIGEQLGDKVGEL